MLPLIFVLAVLAVIVLLPGIGTFIGIVIVAIFLWLKRKEGASSQIGFRRPGSWTRTIILGLVLGSIIEVSFQIAVNPFLERITNTPLDLGPFEDMRGNPTSLAFYLLIGWGIGGFLEEMTYRGFLITHIRRILGCRTAGTAVGLIVTSAAFGGAHQYQDWSGVLSTGLVGMILGFIFIQNRYNLWLPIFTHGFVNTVGMLLIYFNLDRRLGTLLR